jgi:hypothetical protein
MPRIANGDVVRTMRDNLDLICHVHVAGVPTRAEIDNSELNYRCIVREIVDMGYAGFVAQEYRPTPGRNLLVSLGAWLLFVSNFALMANRKQENDVIGGEPAVFCDITVAPARKDQLATPILRDAPEQRMIGQQLECTAYAPQLLTRPLRSFGRDEIEEAFEVFECPAAYLDARHDRARGRRDFFPDTRAAR